MNEFDEFFVSEPSSWHQALPRFQRSALENLLVEGRSYDEVAELWLTANLAHDTYGFGAVPGSRVFYNKVLDQIHDLICTGRGYEEERKTVLSDFKQGQAIAVGTVTEAIAPHVGSYSAFLSVAVVCTFSIISKIGKNAWCEMQTERRRNANPPQAN